MMQFDWTTFILEIVNFLVLVWILQRLIYRPVLAMLDARQQRLEEESVRAKRLRDEADALRLQYETRLADWHHEQEVSRTQLEEELAQLRGGALEELKQTLADEESKSRASNAAMIASRESALIREAAGTAYGQVAAMLQRLASPQLTRSIVDIFLEDLSNLADDELAKLRKAGAMLIAASAVEIVSAHPLDDVTRSALSQALSKVVGRDLPLMFREDADLIAGVRAVVGECQLHANLADELAFFRRQANHG